MVQPADPPASALLLDEFFDSEDDGFLGALCAERDYGRLARFAARWARDPRAWARRQMEAYLALPMRHPAHQPLVRRLFLAAEAAADDAMMAHFMVAFDRTVRRERRTSWRWDYRTSQSFQTEEIVTPSNQMPRVLEQTVNPIFGKPYKVATPIRPAHRLFNYASRYYLRRRAWRYFRKMGYARPDAYPAAAAAALKLYSDADFEKGENILDNWGLLNLGYRHAAALEFTAKKVRLREGKAIADLAPAPKFPSLWSAETAFAPLCDVALRGGARLVRLWAMALIRAHHAAAAAAMKPEEFGEFLLHRDAELQQFGLDLLKAAAEKQPIAAETWLGLLKAEAPGALAGICELMEKHLSPASLDFDQCLKLACARPAPVARLGLAFLKAQNAAGKEAVLAGLARAECETHAYDIAAHGLAVACSAKAYRPELAAAFFDSRSLGCRRAAWDWLAALDSPGKDDPALWSRLAESPYDDVRQRLIRELEARAAAAPATAADLAPVWAAVLLGIHRGGREKPAAVRQVADAIARDPAAEAPRLLPVLTVAVRSIRAPEHRAGLAAIAALLAQRPDLAESIAASIPELKLTSDNK